MEWAGLLALVAAVVVALFAVDLPGRVATLVGHSVEATLGETSAATSVGQVPPPNGSAPGGSQATSGPAASGSQAGGSPSSGNGGVSGAGAAAGGRGARAKGAAGNGAGNRGSLQSRLPTGGQRPYVPPKKSHGKPQRVPGGGFEDADGNIWKWDKSGHAGPHWDVEHPDRSHTNVAPDGTVIGKDNFPNKAPKGGDSAGSTAKKAAGGAAILGGTGAIIWWGAKILSPACGPFAPVCAIVA